MPRLPSSPHTLEGRKFVGTGELTTIQAIYQIGDFRYQVLNRDGWKSAIKNCRRFDTLEWLIKQLHQGNIVIAEVPPYTPKPAR